MINSTRIPSDSLLFTQFSKFRILPRRRNRDSYWLIAKGNEINTAWFSDRPFRGYGHFKFDDITGKSAWNDLFNGDNPNSILSGQGRSLVFETGHFRQNSSGHYISKIKLLGAQLSQDIITGKWNKSSLLIDSTGSEPSTSSGDSSGTVEKIIVGALAFVGLTITAKCLAKKKSTAPNLISVDSRLSSAEEAMKGAQLEFQEAQTLALEAPGEQIAAVKNYFSLSQEVSDAFDKMNKLESQCTTLKNAIIKRYGDYTSEINLWSEQSAIGKIGDYEKFVKYRERYQEAAKAWSDLSDNLEEAYDKIVSTVGEGDEGLKAFSQASKKLKDARAAYEAVRDEANVAKLINAKAQADLEAPLDQLAAQENIADVVRLDANNIGGEMDKSFNNLVELQEEKSSQSVINAAKKLGLDSGEESEARIVKVVTDASKKAFQDVQLLTCGAPLLSFALAGPGCSMSVDSMADFFAEEFEIDKTAIFKDSNLFTEFESELAEIGYESELAELTEYIQGPSFSEEAGPLLSSLTEGALAPEQALGAIDLASVGLGGEAIVDTLAADAGGDFLLGEIALDILEVALLA